MTAIGIKINLRIIFRMKNAYLVLFVWLAFIACSTGQTLNGSWEGELDVNTTKIPIVLHFSESNGTLQVKADSPNQGAFGITGSAELVKEDSILVSLQGGIKLHLKVIGGEEERLEGNFHQSGMKLPVVFKRTAQSEEEEEMQNDALAYPYEDIEFINEFDEVKLSGTISFPKEDGNYPAVVLVSGSGAQNRDSEVHGHKIFKDLASYLNSQGIVVLRYDDRGVGESEGDFVQATIEDFSKDVLSALSFLKERPMVDTSKVGIVGHSEGGLIAFLLAGQQLPDVKFIASLAGPTFTISELMVEQAYHLGKSSGMSKEQLETARTINSKNFNLVKSDLSNEETYQALIDNMQGKVSPEMMKDLEVELSNMVLPGYRYFMRIEPQEFIRTIQVPVFAAFGGKDLQVPADINMEKLKEVLPFREENTINNYPELNHLFQKAKTGNPYEYGQLKGSIDQEVLSDLSSWIKGL